jgi:hypothetical protein
MFYVEFKPIIFDYNGIREIMGIMFWRKVNKNEKERIIKNEIKVFKINSLINYLTNLKIKSIGNLNFIGYLSEDDFNKLDKFVKKHLVVKWQLKEIGDEA